MKSVFISHSMSDTPTVEVLSELLAEEDIHVVKTSSMPLGTGWQAETLSSIRKASVFIAILDQPSKSVMLELGYALGANRQVLLVGGPDMQIPLDVASLHVIRVDCQNPRSLFQIVDVIRNTAADIPPILPDFKGPRIQLEYLLKEPGYLDQMTARDFELLIASFFRDLGLCVSETPPRFDEGYDLLIERLGPQKQSVLVEVKKNSRSSKQGVAAVRTLLGATAIKRASGAILVSTSEYSVSAQRLAEQAPVRIVLMTLEDLIVATEESIIGTFT